MTRPEAAFAALGNEHRMRIVEALWERRSVAPVGADSPVPYTELMAATELTDKGQFNYHLGTLVGPFVEKTGHGYVLTHAGKNVARAVRAGSVTESPAVDGVSVGDRVCPYCGDGGIRMDYRDGVVLFSCTACDGMAPEDPMAPPGAIQAGTIPASALVGRAPEELYDTAIQWGLHVHLTLMNGYCPACAGGVDDRLVLCDDHDSDGVCGTCGDRFAARVRYECSVCGTVEWFPLWGRLLFAEPVFAFVYHRGVNPLQPALEDFALTRDLEEQLRSATPPAIEYAFAVDGETLRVVVDENLAISQVGEGAGETSAEA